MRCHGIDKLPRQLNQYGEVGETRENECMDSFYVKDLIKFENNWKNLIEIEPKVCTIIEHNFEQRSLRWKRKNIILKQIAKHSNQC